MKNDQPLILVTNDDGTFAPGIKALVESAQQFGRVVVVAPDSPQSGKGHAITITQPLKLKKIDGFGDVEAYACNGTPADCVKLAKNVLLKDENIDLCLSGINHGSNASINIIYSGTMSAAMEASLEGIPSIGFSLLDYSFEANFEATKAIVAKIVPWLLNKTNDRHTLLNVNIPAVPLDQINGIKVCRQAEGNWIEEFQEGQDPRGSKYYWLTGRFEGEDDVEDTDLWALQNQYVSVVPSKHDLTDYDKLAHFKNMENAG